MIDEDEQLVFTYFHFAGYRPLVDAMQTKKATCLAYETVELSIAVYPC